MPVLKRLRLKASKNDTPHFDMIISNLENIGAPYANKLFKMNIRLSSRELEICNYLQNGLKSKEIARILNISQTTVERHRNNIRQKMNLKDNQVSLTAFLQNL